MRLFYAPTVHRCQTTGRSLGKSAAWARTSVLAHMTTAFIYMNGAVAEAAGPPGWNAAVFASMVCRAGPAMSANTQKSQYASMGGTARCAKTAAGAASASMGDGAVSAKTAAGAASASMGGGARSAKTAAGAPSASMGDSAVGAKTAAGAASASMGGVARCAKKNGAQGRARTR
jgi:hypothetical protein